MLSAALYPKVFNDYMLFRDEFGPVDGLPTRLFFTGPEIGEEFQVAIEPGKVLNIKILAISNLHPNGQREVFCEMNGQLRTVMVEDKSVTKVFIDQYCLLFYEYSFMFYSYCIMALYKPNAIRR